MAHCWWTLTLMLKLMGRTPLGRATQRFPSKWVARWRLKTTSCTCAVPQKHCKPQKRAPKPKTQPKSPQAKARRKPQASPRRQSRMERAFSRSQAKSRVRKLKVLQRRSWRKKKLNWTMRNSNSCALRPKWWTSVRNWRIWSRLRICASLRISIMIFTLLLKTSKCKDYQRSYRRSSFSNWKRAN